MSRIFSQQLSQTNKKSFSFSPFLLGILVLFFIGLIIFMIKIHFLGSKPIVSLQSPQAEIIDDPLKPVPVGKKVNIKVLAENQKNGICQVMGDITQGRNTVKVFDEKIGGTIIPSDKNPRTLESGALTQDLISLGFIAGPAKLHVEVSDCSLWGRTARIDQEVVVDLTPPRLELTSSQHYINQGGADVVAYRVSDDVIWSGVKVGTYQFKGYQKPGAPLGESFALFVFSYDLPQDTKIEVVAQDAAGNESTTTLVPARFFPKNFRHRELPIEDSFIDTKVVDIIRNTPEIQDKGDRLQNFLLINRDLRKKNAQFLIDIAQSSDEKFYWKDYFRPLMNAAVEANFADNRTYLYQGEKVDNQTHLGFDLAVVEKNPILAGNAGRVAYAGYLGIYGNTVIIDHGYGLMTLYGHLSNSDVTVGDQVIQDQKIGNSGATGLAGGDHLHFSMLIQGVQVNPVEFWDQHWIEDHVYLRLGKESFGQM